MRNTDPYNGTSKTIQSIDRAVEILRQFTVSEPALTLGQLIGRLGLHKASAHRYVTTLRQARLLAYNPTSGEYTLAPQMLAFATVATAGLPIVKTAEPFMNELVQEVGETVVLGVIEGDRPVVVAVNSNTAKEIKVSVRLGLRLDPWWSAQGQVFWAFTRGPDEIPSHFSSDEGERFRADIKLTLEEGLAVHSNESWGIRTLAVPVFRGGELVAAAAVVGTLTTVPAERDSFVAKALRHMVQRFTEDAAKDYDF